VASLVLTRLWKLNQIDSGIAEIKQRAAALDPGRAIMAELQTLEEENNARQAAAKKLSGEQTDLELANKGVEDKIKKFSGQLYGGSVVNSREVENIEKEIAMLKRQREKNDERLLELMEELPPVQKLAQESQAIVDAKKKELNEHRKKAMDLKTQLEAEFKRLSSARPEATKGIEPGLMARYEAIKNKQGGIGMAQISKQGNCAACGMKLPTKSIEMAKDDRVVTCEACHRILYFTEGLI
jgi:predicted  nucleic acid-binding Zn-ribbon protein